MQIPKEIHSDDIEVATLYLNMICTSRKKFNRIKEHVKRVGKYEICYNHSLGVIITLKYNLGHLKHYDITGKAINLLTNELRRSNK